MLTLKEHKDKISCEIATLTYDQFLVQAYGISSCNINYTEGDFIEKLLVKSVLDFGKHGHRVCKIDDHDIDIDRDFDRDRFGFFETLSTEPTGPLVQNITQTIVKIVPEESSEPADPDSFTYTQTTPANIWIVSHNLSFRPNVTITDTNGNEIEASITYISNATVQIEFSQPVAGNVYFS